MSDPLSDAALALYAEAPAGMRPLAGDVESMARELLSLRAEVARLRAEREAAVAEAERAYDASLLDAARAEDRALERDAALAGCAVQADRAMEMEDLVRRAVAASGWLRARAPRWIHVMNAFGLGATRARALCDSLGVDPDEMAGMAPDETQEAPGRREGEPGAEEG